MKNVAWFIFVVVAGTLAMTVVGLLGASMIVDHLALSESLRPIVALLGLLFALACWPFLFAKAFLATLLASLRPDYFDELLPEVEAVDRKDKWRGLGMWAVIGLFTMALSFTQFFGWLAAGFLSSILWLFAAFGLMALITNYWREQEPVPTSRATPGQYALGWSFFGGALMAFPIGTFWGLGKLLAPMGAAYRVFRTRWRRAYLTEAGELPDAAEQEELFLPWLPLTRVDKIALTFIAIIFGLFLLGIWRFEPSGWDTWYHLAVSKRLFDTGHIPLWDNWEFAPEGRPHLYPPMLHLLTAGFGRLFGSLEAGFATVHLIVYPLSLLTGWWFARRLFGPIAALAALTLLFSDVMSVLLMVNPIASCLVNAIAPVVVLLVLRRRILLGILATTGMLYSHLGIPILVLLGLGLFCLWQRRFLWSYLAVTLPSLLLFSPWLMRVWTYRDWLSNFAERMTAFDQFKLFLLGIAAINLLIMLFTGWGLVNLRWAKPRHVLPVLLCIGVLPLLPTYGGRYFIHTLPFYVAIAGFALAPYLSPPFTARVKWKFAAVALLPQLTLMGFMPKPAVFPLPSGPWLAAIQVFTPAVFGKEQGLRKDGRDLIAYLTLVAKPGEIIHVDEPWISNLVACYTDLRGDKAAWWEVGKQGAAEQTREKELLSKTGILIVQDATRLPKGVKTKVFGRFTVAVVREKDEQPEQKN